MGWLVTCLVCNKEFEVPKMISPVPKHPREGEAYSLGYVTCSGSGMAGRPISPSSPLGSDNQ